jgi:hypothetical protein
VKSKLEVGDTLGEVFRLYGSQARLLLPTAFWLFLITSVLSGIAGRNSVLLLLSFVVSVVVGTLFRGMVVLLVRDVYERRDEPSSTGLLRSAWPFVVPLTGAGILNGLGTLVGFVLLIVPGLFLLTIWAVVAPVIVIEGSGVRPAFGRSRELVRGNGWRVSAIFLVSFLIVVVSYLAFAAIALSIANGALLRIVFTTIASMLSEPVGALAVAVLYFRLLAISGEAAQAIPAAPPPPVLE